MSRDRLRRLEKARRQRQAQNDSVDVFEIEDADFFGNGKRIAQAEGRQWNPEREFRLCTDEVGSGEADPEFTTLGDVCSQISELREERRRRI